MRTLSPFPVTLFMLLLAAFSPVLLFSSNVDPDSQLIIPYLLEVSGAPDYISRLFSFKTIDIQPVRDLTLYVDLLAFRLTGLSSILWVNAFLWWLSCLVIEKIWMIIFPDLSKLKIRLMVICFAVYPLFSMVVPWGMARKHLLAFYFILLTTLRFIEGKRGAGAYYTLSVLSHPITSLWPLWAWSQDSVKRKKYLHLVFLMILIIVLNFFYYQSEFFRSLYGQKTNEIFNIPERLLALGHYFFQLVFPYLLSFTYHLGHWSTITGLLALVVSGFLLWKFSGDKKFFFSWSLFFILPLFIVLSKPSFLFDTYLLMPALGIFTILMGVFKEPVRKISPAVFIGVTLIWGGMTFFQSMNWREEGELTRTSFLNRPSCKSAFQHIKSAYELGEKPIPEASNFLRDYDCRTLVVSPMDLINVEASTMLYEEGDTDKRVGRLQKLSTQGIYPHMALAALYIRLGHKTEAERELEEIEKRWGHLRMRKVYIPFVKKVLYPFCAQRKDERCMKLLSPFRDKIKGLQYR